MPNSMQYNQGYVGPPLLDMTFEECAKVLRRMELLTYHSVVMTLRAQGSLTPPRHKLLKDLAALLEIPIERHKAEVRLAVNHEELCTIAFHMEGPNTGLGWQIEGARTVPLPPRPPPLTKYKLIADKAAEMAMKLNAQRINNPAVLPHPTLRREHSRKCKCDEKEAFQEAGSSKTELYDNVDSEKSDSIVLGDETVLTASKPGHQPSPTVVNQEKLDQDIIIEEKVIENETVKLMPPPPAPPPPPPSAAAPPSFLSLSSTSLPQTSVPVQATTCSTVCTQTLTATVAASTLGPSSASLLSTSSTLMLPSGMSIQLREDDTEKAKKRKRSVSHDLQSTSDVNLPQKRLATKAVTKISGPVSVAQGSPRTVTFQAPIKISLNTPVITRNNLTSTVAPSSATQKVIIVSNASAVTTPSILHKSLSVPVIRATHPRLQKPSVSGGIMTASVGTGKIRPKVVTIPAKCRPRPNSIVIPVSAATQNIQLKTALTLKQDSLTVVDHNMKRVPIPGVPGATKILPKPSTMFVVNPTAGGVNVSKATLPSTSRLMSVHSSMTQEVTSACIESTVTAVSSVTSDSTVVTKPPSKSNVVILQKNPTTTQGLTLTAANKEMIGKVLSGKNIITQTGRPVLSIPKNFIQKTLVPSIPVTTAPAGSVIVLDLSQDNVSRNLNLTEILQASGIIPSVSTPPAVPIATVIPTTVNTQQEQVSEQQQQQQEQEDHCEVDSATETKLFISKSTEDWLQVSTADEDSKTFTVEEVNLPYNAEDGETVVTFEEAVQLLNENGHTEETHIETVETIETTEEEQIEVAVIEEDQTDETQVFSVQAGDLGAGDIAFIAEKDIDLNSESVTSQIVIETVTEDKDEDLSSQICKFLPHADDSVHIEQTEIGILAALYLIMTSKRWMVMQFPNRVLPFSLLCLNCRSLWK